MAYLENNAPNYNHKPNDIYQTTNKMLHSMCYELTINGEMASSTESVPPISIMGSRWKASSVGEVFVIFSRSGTEPFSFGGKSYSNTKFPPNVFLTRLCL